MHNTLERYVSQYERGAISRRELLAGLAALCAAPLLASSQPGPRPAQPIPISGLDHVALRVTDVPRSVRFYTDHFGARTRSQSASSAFLDIGQNWMALFGPGAVSTGYPPTDRGVDHIAFHSATHRSLEERFGVLQQHKLDPTSPPGSDRVYFRDPDGIILQLS